MDQHGNYTSIYANGSQCITIDLGKEYNLEEIVIWHHFLSSGRTYKSNVTSVAGSNESYRTVYSGSYVETANGHRIK